MKNKFRRIIQFLSLALITYLFLIQDFTVTTPYITLVGWVDPLVALAGLLTNQFIKFFLVTVVAIILTVLWGRFICGWLCPIGTILDLFGIVTHPIKKQLARFFNKLNLKKPKLKPKPKPLSIKGLDMLRWLIFGSVISFVLLGKYQVLAFNPFVLWPRQVYRMIIGDFPGGLFSLSALGLIMFPRFWCRYICPAGSAYHLIVKISGRRLGVGTECKNCRICIEKCPIFNISVADSAGEKSIKESLQFGADCLNCGRCLEVCPVGSARIHIKKEGKTRRARGGNNQKVNESRRDFILASGTGVGIMALATIKKNFRWSSSAEKPYWSRLLRPPGALPEDEFNDRCLRCGQCLKACTPKVLIQAGLEAGLTGIGTPRFVPRLGKCMICMACGQVCPTGALKPVAYDKVRLGTAEIDHSHCLAWGEGIECLLCVETCPTFAININEDKRPVIDLSKCIGCGACEANCPVDGSAVILHNSGEKRRFK